MEESVHNLKIQRDKYLQEIQTISSSLTEIKDAFTPLNLSRSLVSHVTHMVRTVARKNPNFDATQRGLESLFLKSASLI